ncbi:tetratricopeptide repeat protein [soil metagenome]
MSEPGKADHLPAAPGPSIPHADGLDEMPRPDDAAQLLAAGQPQQALDLAFAILTSQSHTPPMLAAMCRLAGAAAVQLGDAATAEHLLRQALQVDAGDAQALFQLGHLLADEGRSAEAEACFREVLAADPNDAAAWSNLGVLLAAAQQPEEAADCYRRAVTLDPRNSRAHTNLGVLLAAQSRYEDAAHAHRQALAANPEDAAAHTNLGLALESLLRVEEAEASHRNALALNPHTAAIWSNLGNLLAKKRRPASDPTAIGGLDLDALARDSAEAEQCLRAAIRLAPDWAAAHSSLGVFLADRMRDDAAEASLRDALALQPDYQLAHLNLAFLLLAQGRLAEAWPHHEARFHPGLPDNGIAGPPNLAVPMWQGEPIAGCRMLVWAEQGLGDQIQFSRYVRELKQLGAAHVTLVCSPPLKPLFDTLADADEVLSARVIDNAFAVPEADLARHDFWVFPLSLPRWCGTGLNSIPASTPYLRAPAVGELAGHPSRSLPPRGASTVMRVGLVWRGNAKHNNDAERSIPSLATLAPLWAVEGVEFFSLQMGEAAAQAREAGAGQALLPLAEPPRDFADTAAALAQLDLLISVDTSIAHLAGALGTRCWVMLPAYKTDWRWLRGRDDSPWYPGTMRLFRQRQRGDWAALVLDVRDALVAAVQRSDPSRPRHGD